MFDMAGVKYRQFVPKGQMIEVDVYGGRYDIIKILQEELGIRRGQVETTIKLIDEGNMIPSTL